MLAMFFKYYCVTAVVSIKPIYLNTRFCVSLYNYNRLKTIFFLLRRKCSLKVRFKKVQIVKSLISNDIQWQYLLETSLSSQHKADIMQSQL